MAKMFNKGEQPSAEKFNKFVQSINRISNLQVDDTMDLSMDAGGIKISGNRDSSFYAQLTTGSNPHSWVEVERSGTSWITRSGGRTGTTNAYEINGQSTASGKVIEMTCDSSDDCYFKFDRHKPPCPNKNCCFYVALCCGVSTVGLTVTVTSGSTTVATLTTISATGFPIYLTDIGYACTMLPGGTYTVTVSGTGVPTPLSRSFIFACSDQTVWIDETGCHDTALGTYCYKLNIGDCVGEATGASWKITDSTPTTLASGTYGTSTVCGKVPIITPLSTYDCGYRFHASETGYDDSNISGVLLSQYGGGCTILSNGFLTLYGALLCQTGFDQPAGPSYRNGCCGCHEPVGDTMHLTVDGDAVTLKATNTPGCRGGLTYYGCYMKTGPGWDYNQVNPPPYGGGLPYCLPYLTTITYPVKVTFRCGYPPVLEYPGPYRYVPFHPVMDGGYREHPSRIINICMPKIGPQIPFCITSDYDCSTWLNGCTTPAGANCDPATSQAYSDGVSGYDRGCDNYAGAAGAAFRPPRYDEPCGTESGTCYPGVSIQGCLDETYIHSCGPFTAHGTFSAKISDDCTYPVPVIPVFNNWTISE